MDPVICCRRIFFAFAWQKFYKQGCCKFIKKSQLSGELLVITWVLW